jgi:hypothetical protein
MNRKRQTVNLHSATYSIGRSPASFRHRASKRAQLVDVVTVCRATASAAVDEFRKPFGRTTAHSLRGTVRSNQLRMLLFECLRSFSISASYSSSEISGIVFEVVEVLVPPESNRGGA